MLDAIAPATAITNNVVAHIGCRHPAKLQGEATFSGLDPIDRWQDRYSEPADPSGRDSAIWLPQDGPPVQKTSAGPISSVTNRSLEADEATRREREGSTREVAVTRTGRAYVAAMLWLVLTIAGALLPHHADAAARSVHVIIKNNTDRAMLLLSSKTAHGEITRQPSARIPPGATGDLFAESNGIATGTEGWVQYRLEGVPGEARFNWDNPFVGNNSGSGSAPASYEIGQIGDIGNRTLVFFSLHDRGNPVARCNSSWVLANLGQHPENGLDNFDEAVGFLTTPGKRLGIGGWVATGCIAEAAGWLVRDAQHSTDGFWTLDIKLRSVTVDGQNLQPGSQRYIRIEVEPGTPAHGVVDNRPPKANEFIQFGGSVLIDTHHGDELVEVHPWNPIAFAPGPLVFGPGTCKHGFVWREAFSGDHVCVVPGTREQARLDNSQVAQRRQPGGGPSGPDTCRQGFVWREATPADHVCVVPSTRQQAAEDNRHASERQQAP